MRGFLRDVGALAGGTAVAQAVLLLAAPLLTRLYDPVQYGAFTIYGALLFPLASVSALRFELSLLGPPRDAEAAESASLGLLAVAGTALLAGVGVALAGPALARWTRTPGLPEVLKLLPVGIAAAGAVLLGSAWNARRGRFPVTARAQATHGVVRAASQVGAGFLGAGAVGLAAGDVLGRLAAAGTAWVPSLRRDRAEFRSVRTAGLRAAAVRGGAFPLVASGSALLGQAGLQLPPLLFAGLYGPREAGHFGLGQRVVALPLALVGLAIAQVYASRVARLAGRDPSGLRRLFVRTALVLFAVGVVPFGILSASGPQVFSLVFGARWEEAGRYVQVTAPMLLLQFVALPLSQTLHLLDRPGRQLSWDAARLALLVASLWGPAAAGLPASQAVAAYGVAMAAAYASLLVLLARGVWASAEAIPAGTPAAREA